MRGTTLIIYLRMCRKWFSWEDLQTRGLAVKHERVSKALYPRKDFTIWGSFACETKTQMHADKLPEYARFRNVLFSYVWKNNEEKGNRKQNRFEFGGRHRCSDATDCRARCQSRDDVRSAVRLDLIRSRTLTYITYSIKRLSYQEILSNHENQNY